MTRLFPLALAVAMAASSVQAANNAPSPSRPASADQPIRSQISQRFAKDTDETPHFRRHIVPMLGKLGCNGRSCHGSFQGQGGFRLSLFGYDFKLDHDNLTAGDKPRVNKDKPEQSLFIRKPVMDAVHEGGERYEKGGWEHKAFVNWIKGGANSVPKGDADFVRVDVTPNELQFASKGEKVQLKAVAVWADGTREDVTDLCRFKSNDTQVAEITQEGEVTSVEPGDTHVVVFYDNGVVPIPVIRPVSEFTGEKYPQVAAPTKVDQLVVEKLKKLGVVPSDLSEDAEFLRRVSLDLTGTLPSAKDVKAFLADSSPGKREKKINELLNTKAYAAWWTTKLCDFTGNNDDQLNNVTPVRSTASQNWYDWIYQRVEDNKPYDDIVAGIVLGNSMEPNESYQEYCSNLSKMYYHEDGPQFADRSTMPHYWARRNFRQPEERVIGFAYTFLGIRIQCAQCHKHPFDQWTQDDFKQFTPFFTATRSGNNPENRDEYMAMMKKLGLDKLRGNQARRMLADKVKEGKTIPFQEVYTNNRGGNRNRNNNATRNLRRQISQYQKALQDATKKEQKERIKSLKQQIARAQQRLKRAEAATVTTGGPKLLGGDEVDLAKHSDPRKPLMDWLRSKDNPLFAKAFVNRVWAAYFNRGIVEPSDDMSLANPPVNKPLLDHLAQGFIANGFDMKWLHREILNSRTYQLSWRPNDTNRLDERNFSRAVPRRLPAEVTYDALVQATASDEKVAESYQNTDGRAIAIPGAGRRSRGGSGYALQIFGRSIRESNCDCDRSMEPSLLQTVFLQNDRELLAMIDRRRDGWLAEVAKDIGAKYTPTVEGNGNNNNNRNRRRIEQRLKQQMAQLQRQLKAFRSKGNEKGVAKTQKQLAAVRKQLGIKDKPQGGDAKEPGEKIAGANLKDIVNEAYLRTLSRFPNEDELARSQQYITEADGTVAGIRGLLWALLNTKEFIVNH